MRQIAKIEEVDCLHRLPAVPFDLNDYIEAGAKKLSLDVQSFQSHNSTSICPRFRQRNRLVQQIKNHDHSCASSTQVTAMYISLTP
jgi:hypothetical protein